MLRELREELTSGRLLEGVDPLTKSKSDHYKKRFDSGEDHDSIVKDAESKGEIAEAHHGLSRHKKSLYMTSNPGPSTYSKAEKADKTAGVLKSKIPAGKKMVFGRLVDIK
jgi:hypothetical protein